MCGTAAAEFHARGWFITRFPGSLALRRRKVGPGGLESARGQRRPPRPALTPAQVVPRLPPGSVPAFRCRPDRVPTELTAREEEGRARRHPLLTLAGGARGPPRAPEARLRGSRPCTAKFA